MAPNFVSFLSNKFQLLSAIASSSGAGDADKIVATDSGGKISRSFLNRIVAVTSGSNLIAVNADTTDIATITLTENTTFSNPTGTPFDGQLLLYRIVSASSFAIAFGTNFEPASSLSYPLATTGGNKLDEIAARWSATRSKWIYDATTIGAYPIATIPLSLGQVLAARANFF
jgi:hypothetical protein